MAKRTVEASPLYRRIRFGFTAHPITVWAGVILLRLYFEWIKLREELSEALAGLAKHSNNQIPSVDVMLSWFYGLALGAERFEHFTRYRRDRLLGELLGIERFGSPDTLRRLFLRFGYREVTEVSERLMRFSLARMRPILLGHTLDMDSTILCRYGEQEGSLKGYNPKKPGRPSHHPLVAFLAEGRRLLWATLRSGNSGNANGCVEFLKQALTVLPAGQKIGLVRADSGFFEKRLLEYLESQDLPYIIVARLTQVVRKLVIHPDPVQGVAGGGKRHRGRRLRSQSAQLEKRQAPLCLSAPGDLRAAPGQRETINRVSGIYLSGDGDERALRCGSGQPDVCWESRQREPHQGVKRRPEPGYFLFKVL